MLIIIVDRSEGGQIVQRYALASSVYASASTTIRYFPANPSSFTYLDKQRPSQTDAWACGAFCDNTTLLTRLWTFERPADNCSAYNPYGYGLDGPLSPYLASRGIDAMVAAFGERNVTYLSGTSDVCNLPFMQEHSCTPGCVPDDGGLDTSCEAYTQGYCRMARAHAYAQYVKQFYAQRGQASQLGQGIFSHRLVSIPGVGHSGCAVFQSPQALAAMFP